MAPLRSSTRNTPRKKYTVDAFEGIQDLVQYSSASGSEDEAPEVPEVDEESESDVFDEENAQSDEQDDESMQGLEEDEDPVEEVNERSDAGEDDLEDDMSIVGGDDTTTGDMGGISRPKRVAKPPEEETTYVRGVPANITNRINKEFRYKWWFGPTQDDQGPIIDARNRWPPQTALPSRGRRAGKGGFSYSRTFQTDIENAERNWKWYNQEGGRERIEQRQVLKDLTSIEAQPYQTTDFKARTFVMGPCQKQKLYSMQPRHWLSTAKAFAPSETQEKGPATSHPSGQNKGFILNLGAKVHCLDWCPSQSGAKQYLAAAVLPKSRADRAPSEALRAPAFTPQPQYCSSIEVWEFSANAVNSIDSTSPPRLRIVLCAAVGDIKTLKWCPVPHKHTQSLGLLGWVSGDGAIRICDLVRPTSDSCTNILVEKAAFECRAPNTIITSFAWLSSSRVACACANGFVAVWDIEKSLRTGKDNPRPTIFTDVSATYIMSITSCYPSFPDFVVTTSMNGHVMLTDLRHPQPSSRAATALSNRMRIGQAPVAWHDFAHAGVSVEDNQTIRCHAFRRWFNAIGVGKTNGHPSCIAVSFCHPFVLIGSTAGDVLGLNPLLRIVDGAKPPLTQQRWFTHEWRRPNEEEVEAANLAEAEGESSTINVSALIGQHGLSRITEGFKSQTVSVSVNAPESGALMATIYEEKSAVTALSWNPNIHVGGWAAAGMADGLLKVEDIAG